MKNKLILLSLSFMILITSCHEKKQIKKSVRPVKITKVTVNENIYSSIILPASVNELKEVNLAFRVGGPLIQLNNVVGCFVQKDEVIAQIDPRDFEIAVERTETQYLRAKTEYERYISLLTKESVSKSLFEQMETNYKLAKAGFESAKNALADTKIIAPFSGYINMVFVENFEEVKPGASVVSLLDLSKYEVNAWISANDLNSINSNTNYTCVINNGTELRIPGKIKEMGSKSSYSKQSYPISVLIDSPKDFKLRAGMTANLEIANPNDTEQPSYSVPITSVFSKDDNTCVWIFNSTSNTVSLRQVKVGTIISNEMISITEGINDSEYIVTAGVHYLHEGQQVKIMPDVSPSNIGNQL